ncbi:hypothetical protein QNH51_13730, partial [Staphylococcus haemolyticus]|nr:hypothetical protein [Staphylococcus haemolyticus]
MKKRVLITMAASATLLLAGCGNDQKEDKNHYNVLNQSRQAQVLSLLQLQTLHQQNYQRYVLKNGSEKV